jgi:hypothetical protein
VFMLLVVVLRRIPLLTAGVRVDRHLRRNPQVTEHSTGLNRRVRSESNRCLWVACGVNRQIAILLVLNVIFVFIDKIGGKNFQLVRSSG